MGSIESRALEKTALRTLLLVHSLLFIGFNKKKMDNISSLPHPLWYKFNMER